MFKGSTLKTMKEKEIDFLEKTPKAQEVEVKNKQMGLYQTMVLLYSKANEQRSKEVTNRIGKNLRTKPNRE